MNWTSIAKKLVFFNLVLSVIFAAWAAGIYTNRIDWPGAGISGDKAEGEYNRREKEIRDLEKTAGLALARWQTATGFLKTLENQRPLSQSFYQSKLNSLNNNGDKPVTALVYQNNKLVLDANGPAISAPDGTSQLKSRNAYLTAFSKWETDIQNEIKKSKELMDKAEILTLEINGNKMEKTKGLRDLLDELELAQRNTLAELEYLLPLRYNRKAEAELLQKRQASLNGRVNELNRAARK
jgi:hypothetical protein